MRARAFGAALPLLVAVACETLPQDKHSPAPLNACPANACTALAQGSTPACTGGICVLEDALPPLYVVVGLPTYSLQGPSMTFVLTANGAPAPSTSCNGSDVLPACGPVACPLPPWFTENNAYSVEPSASGPAYADFNLGNVGSATTLPCFATYRLLIGPALDDALDLGLPVVPYVSQHFPTSAPFPNGPFDTPPFSYFSAVPPGCYRRTVQPDAPLSSAFPPEITVWSGARAGFESISAFDQTTEELGLGSSVSPFPTFDLSRAEGLDGWTAYLRSIKTHQVTSTVAALEGSLDRGVRLLTNHGGDVGVLDPTTGVAEALAGLELIIAPPPGTPLPAEVLVPLGGGGKPGLSATESYPSLPPPLQVTGRVQTAGGVPVPAVISFTAIDVFKRDGTPFPSSSFEFATTATTAIEPRTGASTYSVVLPQGDYQMVARPTDGANAMSFRVRPFGSAADVAAGADVTVAPLVGVSGQASLADGRGLAEGLVEALPAACPQPASGPASGAPPTDAVCLPSAAQVMARDDGSFSLALDPGSYTLRVTPVQGTRFPWVTQPLVVDTDDTSKILPPIGIPAPVDFSRIVAAGTGAAINAVIRVFTQGSPPVELGRAITDAAGHFDVYLAPQSSAPAPSSTP